MAFQLPVRGHLYVRTVVFQKVPRQNLVNVAEDALAVGFCGAQAEDLAEALLVDLSRKAGIRENALELGGEEEGLADHGVEQRLYSQPVADQKELFQAFVPNRKGKDAV